MGDLDLHLFGEGRHEKLWKVLGAHVRIIDGVSGTSFAVWSPNARKVSVVGDFNNWDGRVNPMRLVGSSGVWEVFIANVASGVRYKFELVDAQGNLCLRADPFAFATEVPPATASVVHESNYVWADQQWMSQRSGGDPLRRPMLTYEVHLASWRRVLEEHNRSLSYRELAVTLVDYVFDMGFTHVELLPISEHPYGPSWGYQVSGYFAPTARFGSPDDFRFFVDAFHQRGIGVIVDWVPAHFPKDDWALARFDGTALFEHLDPRQGEHPDWGTLVFNLGRNEVRNFLMASALYWIEEMHIDGLRVDAVASMLYLDYSRESGDWLPNTYGGRENLDSVAFLQELNTVVHGRHPGILMIAEESTAWPGVSRPVDSGGLGFGLKWNMGWMHDTLAYFAQDPINRRYHHHQLTFGLLYAFSENFVLPLSHDEVVHGKGSMLGKMPGDRWQQFANLRALYAWMWAHPGKKLIFMGDELGQIAEWNHDQSIEWDVLLSSDHAGIQRLVRDLNQVVKSEPALWSGDFDQSGFQWVQANEAELSCYAFIRWSSGECDKGRPVLCIANLTPVPREARRVGVPYGGNYSVLVNTDASELGGSGTQVGPIIESTNIAWDGMAHSIEITFPPLAVVWLAPELAKGDK